MRVPQRQQVIGEAEMLQGHLDALGLEAALPGRRPGKVEEGRHGGLAG